MEVEILVRLFPKECRVDSRRVVKCQMFVEVYKVVPSKKGVCTFHP